MKVWWVINSARLASEKRTIEQLPEEKWFRLEQWRADEGRLAVEGLIIAHGREYPIRLVYPDQFPSVPAWVEPRQTDVRWSLHQYGKGGVLCLELRPDNWNPAATGADVLRSAFSLLDKENPLGEGEKGEVESAHYIGEIQSYETDRLPVILTAACFERLQKGLSVEPKAIRAEFEDNVWPIVVSDEDDRKGPRRPPIEKIGTWGTLLPLIVVHADPPERGDGKISRNELLTALKIEAPDPSLVLIFGQKRADGYHLWGEDAYLRKIVILNEELGHRSGTRSDFGKKSVAIIGGGSLGSKVAETLARVGVGRLVLVDGDLLLPGNLERHTLDWREVGFLKVHGLRRRIASISPGSEVDVISHNLNWQRSAKTHAAEVAKIAECDLIIDATGDAASSLFLGSVAEENKRPFLSAVVFEGGLGALVSRSIPGRDASYSSGLAAYIGYCDSEKTAPPPVGKRNYESISESGDPVVADDAAVSMAAAYLSRIAIDVLDGSEQEAEAWLLIGFRKGWLFKRLGHLIALNVGGPGEAIHAKDEAAFEFAVGLVKEALNAAKPS